MWRPAGLELNTCAQGFSLLGIGELGRNSAAWPPFHDTQAQICCWLYSEQCSVPNCYYLDRAHPDHPPLTSRPPQTPWSVCVSSSMISFSCSDVSWVARHILCHSWNPSWCSVLHRPASIGRNIYVWNITCSFLSIQTYIHPSTILLPKILFSLLSSILFRIFQSLCTIV